MVAMGLGLIAAWLFSTQYKRPTVIQEIEKPEEKRVVVAARKIAPGEILAADSLKVERWPKDMAPVDSFDNPEALCGRQVKDRMYQGDVFREERLVPKGSSLGLSGRIEPGMRAVSIKVDEVSGIAGLLQPGDMVDVMAISPVTPHPAVPDLAGIKISRLILQNVRVLDAGESGKGSGKKKARSGKTVTLLLTLEEAGKLAVVADGAKLRLIGRGYSDGQDTNTMVPMLFSSNTGVLSEAGFKKLVAGKYKELAEKNRELHARIRPGMRAVTIPIENEDSFCGLLMPGDRVDLIATSPMGGETKKEEKRAFIIVEAPGKKGGKASPPLYSRVVLQDVEVIATEQVLKKEGEESVPVQMATLLLSPRDAEKLTILYHEKVPIRLTSRNYADRRKIETKGASLLSLYGEGKEWHLIETIRGVEVEMEKFVYEKK